MFVEQTNTFKQDFGRKSIQEAFWNDDLHKEIVKVSLQYYFHSSDDRESCMAVIDEIRASSLYHHTCQGGCKARG